MSVPPLPSPRSPRDGDALAGRRGLVGGSRGSGGRFVRSDPSTAADASATQGSLTPALLTDDARGAVSILNEARNQAAQLAGDLEHLDAAEAGATRVQKLLGRLGDVAVVALDHELQPPQRAALQRQVDLVLGEIDAVADGTMVDEGLLRGGNPTGLSDGPDGPQLTPFRAISTSGLGIGGLAVRSADQALAAAGALDVAATRLQRSSSTVSRATSRLQGALQQLIGPPNTVNGEAALGSVTAALTSAMLLRAQVLAQGGEAIQAQSGLEVGRVLRLLASPDD